jgi:hypothetical protein
MCVCGVCCIVWYVVCVCVFSVVWCVVCVCVCVCVFSVVWCVVCVCVFVYLVWYGV